MSSRIPIHRPARSFGSRAAANDTENTHAQTSRLPGPARIKSALAAAATEPAGGRLLAATASSKAKAVDPKTGPTAAAAKRKRDILSEVVQDGNREQRRGVAGTELKGKESLDGVVIPRPKPKTRQPLQNIPPKPGHRRTRSGRSVTAVSTASAVAELSSVPEVDPFAMVAQASTAATGSTDDSDELRAHKKRHTEVERHVLRDIQGFSADNIQEPPSSDYNRIDDASSNIEEDRVASELNAISDDDEEKWDDLDAEDFDDPLSVPDYLHEIIAYLHKTEGEYLPKTDYMKHHPELSWHKRSQLIEWISAIHGSTSFNHESLFLFVNILDRFCSRHGPVSMGKYQLVGLVCFLIACKYEENVAPSMSDLVDLSGKQYAIPEILKAEQYVLRILGWELNFPGPMTWLRRGSKADDLDHRSRTFAKYFLEVAALQPELVATRPSLIAATSLWMARLALEKDEWDNNLRHYTGFRERDILPVATIIVNYLAQPVQHKSLYQKFADKRYMKSSVFMRKWMLNRFEEGAVIDLAEILPALRIHIQQCQAERARRRALEAQQLAAQT